MNYNGFIQNVLWLIKNYSPYLLVIVLISIQDMPKGFFPLYPRLKNEKIDYYKKGNDLNYYEASQDIKNNKKHLHISIDFGNYKTSYSYCFETCVNGIHSGVIHPTVVILYKSNLTAKNFGQKSMNSIVNYDYEEKNQIIYYSKLKSKLYNAQKRKTNLNIKKAVIEFLRLFSDTALNEINSLLDINKYEKYEVNWILTVPGMSDEYSKLLIVECAKKAGLNNLIISLESEAGTLDFFHDNSINYEYKKQGKIFMIIVIGAYKADILINEIINKYGDIKELTIPLGDNFGSNNINNDIKKIIKDIFGTNALKYIKNNQIEKYFELMDEIEKIKINFKSYKDDELNGYIQIKARFDKIINNDRPQNFNYEEYIIKYDNRRIFFPKKLINQIIQKRVFELIEYIKKIKNEYYKYKIDYMILLGGFSNCDILQIEFKKNFLGIKIFTLMNPDKSIMNGALIFSENQKRIKIRKNQYKYGIISFKEYENNHICNKTEFKSNIQYCQYMDMIAGKEIENKYIYTKSIAPASNNQDKIYLNIFRTKDEELTNSKNDYFGTLEININYYTKVNITIVFSTYIEYYAFDLINSLKLNINFYPKED